MAAYNGRVCMAVADAAGHTLQVPVEVSSVEVGDNMIPVPTRRATMPLIWSPKGTLICYHFGRVAYIVYISTFRSVAVAGCVHQMTSQPPATVEPAATVSPLNLSLTQRP